MAKPKLMLYIIGGIKLIFHPFICWSKGAMFTTSDFGIAQSLSIGLHCPISFGKVGWHSWNVPLEYMGCNLQHRCGMYRNMLYKFQQLLYTCSFFLVIRNKIGMVHFARLMWIALGNGGEVSYSSVELNNFESSKSQSLMLWSLGPDKTSWPPLVDLDLYTWSLNHSHYHDL